MNQVWQLQEAKNKFSQVVENALHKGPQIVTRHGKNVVIILSFAEYREMTVPKGSLVDFFRQSPLVGIDIDLTRDKSPLPDALEL